MSSVVPNDLGMPARPKVGAQIRRARQLLDWRQQDLAEKLGVSRNTVDSWENDRAYPQRKAAKIEQLLGITLEGEPQAPGGIEPTDEWERLVMLDESLPLAERVQIIQVSRRARARVYPAAEPRPAGGGREVPGSRAG